MFSKTIAAGHAILTIVLVSAPSIGQAVPTPSNSAAGLEFPVTMRQNVVAGATPVGTRIQAKLTVATLVNGVVVSEGALLSGEVIESVAKSATDPSRLAIRMDSAQWKNKSAPIRVYLTAWYYPAAPLTTADPSIDPTLPPAGQGRGNGIYRMPTSPTSKTFPGRGADPDNDASPARPAPAPSISQHRVLMKNVESTRNDDGAVSLTSRHFNIKLNKQTTYVLATAELGVGPV